jgi:hypothetical protein
VEEGEYSGLSSYNCGRNFGWISRAFEQFEKLFNLKQLLEPELLALYNFILAGRNDKAIRLQIGKLKILVQNCLTKHGL